MIVGGGPYITIMPARPDYIVVPYYDPVVVYARPRPGFFIGAAIGFRFGVTLGVPFRPWGWGYNRIAWDRRVVFINNSPWQRTWVNRHEYVHPYTVRRTVVVHDDHRDHHEFHEAERREHEREAERQEHERREHEREVAARQAHEREEHRQVERREEHREAERREEHHEEHRAVQEAHRDDPQVRREEHKDNQRQSPARQIGRSIGTTTMTRTNTSTMATVTDGSL